MTHVMGKADLHLHTRHSDGEPTVRQLLDHVAAHTTLDVIAITDHDTIAGALEAREIMHHGKYPFDLVLGEEVSTRDGHLVGLFLRERIPPGLSAAETTAMIHAQGGLAFAPHPFFRARQTAEAAITMVGLGHLLEHLALDAVETINATPFLGRANRHAATWNARARASALGNSDGHILAAVGKGYTAFPGRTADAVYAAIRSGRTVASARPYSAGDLLSYLRFWLRHTGGRVPSYLWPDRAVKPLGGVSD